MRCSSRPSGGSRTQVLARKFELKGFFSFFAVGPVLTMAAEFVRQVQSTLVSYFYLLINPLGRGPGDPPPFALNQISPSCSAQNHFQRIINQFKKNSSSFFLTILLSLCLRWLLPQKRLAKDKQDAVTNFMSFTGAGYVMSEWVRPNWKAEPFALCRQKVAIHCLGAHNWNLEVAVDDYFANPPLIQDEPQQDQSKLDTTFAKYASTAFVSSEPCQRTLTAYFNFQRKTL